MFRINNNDFNILIKYKKFITELDKYLENIPRKDYFYKDKIRNSSNEILELILECNYTDDNIEYYNKKIKSKIAYLDFMLERLYNMKYINESNLYNIGSSLVEINKLVTGWLKFKDGSET